MDALNLNPLTAALSVSPQLEPSAMRAVALSSGSTSLREVVTGMASHETRLYHVGTAPVKRSTMSDANSKRPWQVFSELFAQMLPQAHRGLRLATAHTNARGFAHGGLIAALTDKAMGHSCGHKMRGAAQSLVTVSMAIDFISSGQIGKWLTVETDVIKTGSTICFAQSLVKADDVVIARANATFRAMLKKDA